MNDELKKLVKETAEINIELVHAIDFLWEHMSKEEKERAGDQTRLLGNMIAATHMVYCKKVEDEPEDENSEKYIEEDEHISKIRRALKFDYEMATEVCMEKGIEEDDFCGFLDVLGNTALAIIEKSLQEAD